ncbi:MAG TPA: hypothetical protein DFS52_12460 [Myxococcales bacterium]|nr:hypothetical protein [Myxococcales bacterium]
MADTGARLFRMTGWLRGAGSRLVVAALTALWAMPAAAVQYETEIDIETEQDLYDLQLEGEISETTLETLLELHRTGVDLNLAGSEELYQLPNLTYAEVKAILSYRKQAGRIDDPADLVAANVLSPKALVQIAPFLVVTDADPRRAATFGGRAQYGIGWSNGDDSMSPMYLRGRVKGPYGLSAGLLALTTRRRLGELEYDAARKALSAPRPGYAFHLPKLFLEWDKARYGVIVGSYRIGFGERLTLDNTTKYTPDGYYGDDVVFVPQDLESLCRESTGELSESPCSEADRHTAVTPDFSWRDSFRGAAARAQVPVGDFQLRATAFGSYQSRSIYQYEIFDRRACGDDPHSDAKGCSAPSVYVRGEDPTAYASKHSYATLPNIYDELAAGGNLTLKHAYNGYVGLTGYYASPSWSMGPELQLDFQEWSRTPYNGPYGAVGVNGGLTLGSLNFFAEAARSFDSMKDGPGGGFGVVQRTTLSALAQELELLLRYYDAGFANPYSRATAAPDEYDGLRNRNEAGARLRYRGVYSDWVFNADTDVWFWPEDGKYAGTKGTASAAAKARVQFQGYNSVQPWVSLEYKNKDLSNNADSFVNHRGETVGACYETGEEREGVEGVRPCSGSFYRAAAGIKIVPLRELSFDVRYQHEWLNDAKHVSDLRQDSVFRATIAYRPIDQLRVRLRARYLFEDTSNDSYLEESLWTYLQVSWMATKQIQASLRYDVYALLDSRENTLARNSVWNDVPEQRARLELEASF